MFAAIVVKDGKVNCPFMNDSVTVKVEIQLPCKNKKSEYLLDDLVFGDRVYILGESLNCNWGTLLELKDRNYRMKSFRVEAETFPEATRLGISRAKAMLEPLKKAIQERERKVRKAGKFEEKEITIKLK